MEEQWLKKANRLLVQQSFALLEPALEPLMDLFFARLFQMEPSLRNLFPNDLSHHKRIFCRTLALIICEMEELAQLDTRVEELGKLYIALGLDAGAYDTLGAALVWTVEIGLGEAFTLEMRTAWSLFYGEMAKGIRVAASNGNPSLRTGTYGNEKQRHGTARVSRFEK